MAIAPTGAIYKALTFDGISSRTYGVYITGKAVYNAPERNVEMITIPGRNGAFALDHGRFENIEVTYPAGIFADTETDFADAISDFRNFLCSKEGYVRLTDEYNPSEYRMAVYKSGLEVTPAMLKAGQFDITFQCMPQRWLTSGESKVTVANNGTITNPTLFASSPMLEVTGYGNIDINSNRIVVENTSLGRIKISDYTENSGVAISVALNTANVASGDSIYALSAYMRTTMSVTPKSTTSQILGVTTTDRTNVKSFSYKDSLFYLDADTSAITFNYGTARVRTASWSGVLSYRVNGVDYTSNATWSINYSYNGDSTINVTSVKTNWATTYFSYSTQIQMPAFYADSTVGALGHPLYIDLESGEAWNNDNGTPVSSNNGVSMPANLPVLVSGSNTITYDNTVTDLKIVPRWWKV